MRVYCYPAAILFFDCFKKNVQGAGRVKGQSVRIFFINLREVRKDSKYSACFFERTKRFR